MKSLGIGLAVVGLLVVIAVAAGILLAPDFDTYTQLIKPGGIGSESFIRTWGTMVRAMDTDNFIALMEHLENRKFSLVKRWLTRAMIRGLQRPDPEDMPVFERALEEPP